MLALNKKRTNHKSSSGTMSQKYLVGRAVSTLMAVGFLAACSSGGFLGGGTAPTGVNGGTARMQQDVLAAICEGHAEDAIAIMTSEPLMSAADRFFIAIATEEAGHAARARMQYARLMQSGSMDKVSVRCGRRILAQGTVSDEAAKRLAAVARDLAVMDANLRPTPSLHEGLPSAAFVSSGTSSGGNNGPVGPARAVNRPGSQSPFGQWFAHLVSYRSIETATKNRTIIEAKFPSFAGIIDQWEVDVGGLAIRLGVRLSDRAEADDLCGAVKSQGEYCAVMDTSN